MIPPDSGVVLTTPNKYETQKNYFNVIYSNPATITSLDLSTAGGIGVLGTAYGTVAVPDWNLVNLSTIIGGQGVGLANGGSVYNAATAGIYGTVGIGVGIVGDPGAVTNLGTILATSAGGSSIGVDLGSSGALTNGATNNATAYISGDSIGAFLGSGSVTNYGSIAGATGVYLYAGGNITNAANGTGAPRAAIRGDTVAGVIIAQGTGTVVNDGLIRGATGIEGKIAAVVTVLNSGVIYGDNRAGIDIGPGVYLLGGGSVYNQFLYSLDSTITHVGTITGGAVGIETGNKPANILNLGLIEGEYINSIGVELNSGGLITNGSMSYPHPGTISGSVGVIIQGAAGTLINAAGALITGTGTYSSNFGAEVTGRVDNYGTIQGSEGVAANWANFGTTTIFPTLFNIGDITAHYGAVSLGAFSGAGRPAATFMNSAEAVGTLIAAGFIQGDNDGVALDNVTGTVTNLGTIKAIGGGYPKYQATGLFFNFSDGTIVNGSPTYQSAYIFGRFLGIYVEQGNATITNYGTIKGSEGIVSYGGTHSNTVVNFGTIIGTGGFNPIAISFGKGDSRLIDEPGAVFVGAVNGGHGFNELDLENGTIAGTAAGLGSTFANFAFIYVAPASTWYIDGSNFVNLTNSGGLLDNYGGTVHIRSGAAFTNTGSLENNGTLFVDPHGKFTNTGSVFGGITLQGSATLINSLGEIRGIDDIVVATGSNVAVNNQATIEDIGSVGSAIVLTQGGTVINGSRFVTTPVIDGVAYGITAAATNISEIGSTAAPDITITNFATITGKTAIDLADGGIVTNGVSGATAALIRGVQFGIVGAGSTVNAIGGTYVLGPTITNDATISSDNIAISLTSNGDVTNGASGATAALISGGVHGVDIKGAGGAVANDGTIIGGTALGVYLSGYGTVRNGSAANTSAFIRGGAAGIDIQGNYAGLMRIDNFGTVVSDGMAGIGLQFGYGTIVNGALASTTALISGSGLAEGISNTTTKTGETYPALTISNFGTIAGIIGVDSQGATELTNFGTIIGSSGTAVVFGANNAVLIDEPGSAIKGTVVGGSGLNLLHLTAGTPAANGALFGFGSYFAHFGSIMVDPGANWYLLGHSTFAANSMVTNDGTLYVGAGNTASFGGTVSADAGMHGTIGIGNTGTVAVLGSIASNELLSFVTNNGMLQIADASDIGGNIAGFMQSDTIELLGLTANQATWSDTVLTVASGGIPVAELTLAGDYTGARFFAVPDDFGNTDITTTFTPCFAAGTRIMARRGEVAVEHLREGDVVWSQFAGWTEVRWIGHRKVDCRRHPKPEKVWPVRVAAGAFGSGRPCRDLLLSPDHALFLCDVLIPIKHLINGTSIVQVPTDAVTYYHVELRRHDILLAEGLWAESYLDTGDRENFANGGAHVALHPEFAIRTWDAAGCAPLIVGGPQLVQARLWVNALAAWARCGKLAA